MARASRGIGILLYLFVVLLAWAAVCWFSKPFGRPFLDLPVFAIESAVLFFLSAIALGGALLLWLIFFSKAAMAKTRAWLGGNTTYVIVIAVLLLVHLCLQLPSIVFYQGSNNADSGQYGIAAYHIASGEIRPMYMIGKHHIGSLLHHITAVMNLTFGKSAIHLRIVNTLFYLGFIIVFAGLIKRLADSKAALIAAALLAIPPRHVYYGTTYSEFPEIFLWGALALLICSEIVRREKPSAGLYFSLGIFIGLGLWTQLMFLSFILAVLLVLFIRDKLFFIRLRTLAILPGFAIGGVVFLVHVFFYSLPFSNQIGRAALGLGRWASEAADSTARFISYIPSYLGLQDREATVWLFPPLIAAGVILLFAACLAIYLFTVKDELKKAFTFKNFGVRKLIFGPLVLTVYLVLVASAPIRGAESVRYIFPIWLAFAAIIAMAVATLARRNRIAGYTVLALFLAVFFASTYTFIEWVAEREGQHREWVEFCGDHGITAFYGPWVRTYWTSYVTEEKIVGANFPYYWEPFFKYQLLVEHSESPVAYVFSTRSWEAYLMRRFDEILSALGVSCKKTELHHGIVYYDLSQRVTFSQLHGIKAGSYKAEIVAAELSRVDGLGAKGDLWMATVSVRNSGDVTWLPAGRNGYIELVALDGRSTAVRRAVLNGAVEPGGLVSWRLLLDGGDFESGVARIDLRVNDVSILESGRTLRLDRAEAVTGAPLTVGELNPARLGDERHNLLAEDFVFLDGWGERPENGIWSTGRRSRIGFVMRQPRELELIMRIRPFDARFMPVWAQRVSLKLNGTSLSIPVSLSDARTVRMALPASALRSGLNVLTLEYCIMEREIRPITHQPNLRLRPRAVGINYLRLRNLRGEEGS